MHAGGGEDESGKCRQEGRDDSSHSALKLGVGCRTAEINHIQLSPIVGAEMSGLQSHPAWQVLLDNKTNKPYYYNRSANINTYTVPDDLLTPAQVRRLPRLFTCAHGLTKQL